MKNPLKSIKKLTRKSMLNDPSEIGADWFWWIDFDELILMNWCWWIDFDELIYFEVGRSVFGGGYNDVRDAVAQFGSRSRVPFAHLVRQLHVRLLGRVFLVRFRQFLLTKKGIHFTIHPTLTTPITSAVHCTRNCLRLQLIHLRTCEIVKLPWWWRDEKCQLYCRASRKWFAWRIPALHRDL